MIIPSFQSGEIVKDGKVQEKQYKPIDTDTLEYCWRHNLTLTSDWKNPNEEDKKQLEKIRLVEREVKNEDGSIHKFRICPKCWNIIEWTKVR